MGWNTYNHYSCSPTESIVHSNALALQSLGLQALGYHYVTIDCGWTLPNRTSTGKLQENAALFPSGFPAMAVFLHGLGFGFGVYSDGGTMDCMTGSPQQAGSLNNELIDAQTFFEWGADALKYDNCYSDAALDYPATSYNPSVSPQGRYQNMSNALATLPKPMLFQLCEWGIDFPALWAPAMGNTYRITNDIIPSWRTIPRILNQAVPQTQLSGPGHWADLDMLEVGNHIFTIPEEQTHFSMWAILKSPLTIGCALKDDVTSISAESLAILSNKEVIAFNQDSLGVSASFKRRWTVEQYELWAGPLSGGRTVVALINLAATSQILTFNLPDAGIQTAATVKNVWAGTVTYDVVTRYLSSIPAHGIMLLELNGTTPAGAYSKPVKNGTTYTFTDVYGLTTSTLFNGLLTFINPSTTTQTITVTTSLANDRAQTISVPANAPSISFLLTLLSSSTNTVTITSTTLTPATLTITNPPSNFIACTAFNISGTAKFQTCKEHFCQPVGINIGFISPAGSASVAIPRTPAPSATITTVTKYLEIYFINNDIAIANSFGNGTNTRNFTLSLNGADPVRVEVPLSGRSSELYSPMLGWGDTSIFNISLAGFGVGSGEDVLTFSNVNGGPPNGVQGFGPDIVGIGVVG